MNKTAKSLLIPIAAFAVTATGVSAFNSDALQKAGLSEDQITAFEIAHERRKDGDKAGARDVLKEAGIDLETMESVRESMHAHKMEMRTAIDEAVENNDFSAFLIAIEGSPIADIVTTEDEFELFVEAHELREAGEKESARAIMEELGFEGHGGHMHGHHKGHGGEGRFNGFRGQ